MILVAPGIAKKVFQKIPTAAKKVLYEERAHRGAASRQQGRLHPLYPESP